MASAEGAGEEEGAEVMAFSRAASRDVQGEQNQAPRGIVSIE